MSCVKKFKSSWCCAARVAVGPVSLELFTPDGTVNTFRSFSLLLNKEGKTYSCRLKEAEVFFVQAVLGLTVKGSTTFQLFKDRVVSVTAMPGTVTIRVKDGSNEQKVVLQAADLPGFQPEMDRFLVGVGFEYKSVAKDALVASFKRVTSDHGVVIRLAKAFGLSVTGGESAEEQRPLDRAVCALIPFLSNDHLYELKNE